ncbi:MAG TPA: RNA degradosome polyphosphate kinase [Paludibacter sp.]|nr:RNA degradosome polyphosphate kinase [Paludibacter sp.]
MSKINKKKILINRDISWMYFNRRILDEASNTENPLIERLKFVAIYSNNLDEFFRVRVATLRRMIEIEESVKDVKSNSNSILKSVLKLNEKYTRDLEIIFANLIEELKSENIYFVDESQVTDGQAAFIESYYNETLKNSLFPILVSRMEEEPILNDKSIYLAIKISSSLDISTRRKKEYALIQIPSSEIPRFVILPPDGDKQCVIFIDDIIRYCLPKIFSPLDYDQFEAYTIKFTRDSEMDFDNSAYYSTLEKVSKAVKSRKTGVPVRFVFDKTIPGGLLRFIQKLLKIDKRDAHVGGSRYHNLKDFISFPVTNRPDLKYPPQPPLSVPAFDNAKSMIHLIRVKDQYLHYPYHNFDNFIRLLREAAISPDIKSIKISIYRLAKNSKVIKALICAAMNGKKVTAIVELLARFDESSNINWAQKMQEAGIKVLFGVEGLKVHSKLTLITARNRSIACISTGNFHEGTAAIYTDFTLMTANSAIVDEVESVFDYIEHPYLNPVFKELIVSPNYTRKKIIGLIKTEIDNAEKNRPAYILMKVNHIVDEKIISKLYQASKAGVEIKLLVRGNCSIIAGVKNQSENIEVYGIIDRYLEHSRIMIFGNGGDEKYFIGSADLMERNLDHRIEVYTPVYDADIKKQLRRTIEYGLRDNTKARIVDGKGNNELHKTEFEGHFSSQKELYNFYKQNIQTTTTEDNTNTNIN